jgi:hypothetical protein
MRGFSFAVFSSAGVQNKKVEFLPGLAPGKVFLDLCDFDLFLSVVGCTILLLAQGVLIENGDYDELDFLP